MRNRPAAGPAWRLTLWLVAAVPLGVPSTASAQADQCVLVADDRNPPEQILRCRDSLVVRTAHDARYRPVDPAGNGSVQALQVDMGAIEVQFHPGERRRNFQILTPDAIAAVRGTKWIVDVSASRTSIFVIEGTVAVRRRALPLQVYLDPGQGVDVTPGSGTLTVKRWPPARVRALLARFGE